MTIRHFRIFIAVANTGSITRAAQALYVSQPTVSVAIRELEQHYGTRLFERISQRLKITEAGRALLGYATHLISLYDEVEASFQNPDSHGLLRVGASVTFGVYGMPALAARFAARPRAALPAAWGAKLKLKLALPLLEKVYQTGPGMSIKTGPAARRGAARPAAEKQRSRRGRALHTPGRTKPVHHAVGPCAQPCAVQGLVRGLRPHVKYECRAKRAVFPAQVQPPFAHIRFPHSALRVAAAPLCSVAVRGHKAPALGIQRAQGRAYPPFPRGVCSSCSPCLSGRNQSGPRHSRGSVFMLKLTQKPRKTLPEAFRGLCRPF